MDKRYQVFVSSTYTDLQKERQEVMQALLELDCIPSGMELFTAADEDQWTLIKSIIDDCDYYIVIVGGRYGSTNKEGMSYTEMEYRYAIDVGKPIIGFLHRDPDDLPVKKTEKTEKTKEQLEVFRNFVQEKMCQFWTSPADLGSKVSRSMMKLIKQHPAIGWVRADQLPSKDVNLERLSLRKRIEELNIELELVQNTVPEGTENLAQGEDIFTIKFHFHEFKSEVDFHGMPHTGKVKVTWNEIFYTISPSMINESSEKKLIRVLETLIKEKVGNRIKERFKSSTIRNFVIHSDSFQTIIVQLRALGLISKSLKNRSVKDTETYWELTPYGDTIMTRLRAIETSNPH